jgi:hypothetical protein
MRVHWRQVNDALAELLMLPKDWAQVNEDGFGYGVGDGEAKLFTFGSRLFARTNEGIFRMESLLCARWRKVYTPVPKPQCVPLGSHLYCVGSNGDMQVIGKGGDFNAQASWQQVVSNGVPGGAHPWPMTIFGGHVYAVLHPAGTEIFEIWRSADVGKSQMTWSKAVSNSFGHPENNQGVDFMGACNGRLYAGTNSLVGNFGGEQPGDGVEVWESPTGDAGSWKQVNTSGFGTQITNPFGGSGSMRTNHMIGSWAVYRPPGHAKSYLHIGTSSHWGGEIWRYQGTGSSGWKMLWSACDPNFSQPARNNAIVPYKGSLWVAQGFGTGDLLRYDSAGWHVVEHGPHPFHAENGGIADLTVHAGTLYAITLHKPYGGTTKGDQVYAHPFYPVAAFVCKPKSLVSTWLALYQIARDRMKRAVPSTAQSGPGVGRGRFTPELEDLDAGISDEP